MTPDEQIAALRRWPKVLARSFIGKHAPDVRPTYAEWIEAAERFEQAISLLKPHGHLPSRHNRSSAVPPEVNIAPSTSPR